MWARLWFPPLFYLFLLDIQVALERLVTLLRLALWLRRRVLGPTAHGGPITSRLAAIRLLWTDLHKKERGNEEEGQSVSHVRI